MLNFLSLFSGIGAFEKALDRLGVEYNLVNYCEIDKYASKSYSAIHNVPESLNLGDITKVNAGNLPRIDMISYGFPCQDISLAGKQKGLFNEDGTTTRSGLFFEALRIIEDTKPKVAIAENVKNLTSKKFKEQFDIVLDSLEQAGYNNYWQVLNAKDYGVPQNRERVFIVSIRKDIDNGRFKFPEPFKLELRLKDLLEFEVDEKYYLSEDRLKLILNWKAQQRPLTQVLGNNSISRTLTARGAGEYHSGMITYSVQLDDVTNVESLLKSQKVTLSDLNIRLLTELEAFRLTGFDDEDFCKAKEVTSSRQLYKQAGNSIVVDVLEYLFKEILEVLDVKKVEDKVVVYECNDLIDVAALKEKEPELYAELLADYPCENATYVFKNFCN